jgi:hypothetical protein
MRRASAGTANECKSERHWVIRRSLRAGRKFAAPRKIACLIDHKAMQIKQLGARNRVPAAGRRSGMQREAAGKICVGI